jgi:TolA-binding protein
MFKAKFKAKIETNFRVTMIAAVLLLGLTGVRSVRALGEPQASAVQTKAPEAWRKEFDDVCSKTQDAMTFSQDELTDLIRRCDALLPQIEKLDESRKKVYTGRLRMCRGLYAYVLDAKNLDSKKQDPKKDSSKNEKK